MCRVELELWDRDDGDFRKLFENKVPGEYYGSYYALWAIYELFNTVERSLFFYLPTISTDVLILILLELDNLEPSRSTCCSNYYLFYSLNVGNLSLLILKLLTDILKFFLGYNFDYYSGSCLEDRILLLFFT